jgi:hypothetical protein
MQTAGMVRHEMNQPMQVILGHADLLSMDLPEEAAQRRRIETIQEQIIILWNVLSACGFLLKPSCDKAYGNSDGAPPFQTVILID